MLGFEGYGKERMDEINFLFYECLCKIYGFLEIYCKQFEGEKFLFFFKEM